MAREIGVSGDARAEEKWRPAGEAYPMPPMKTRFPERMGPPASCLPGLENVCWADIPANDVLLDAPFIMSLVGSVIRVLPEMT